MKRLGTISYNFITLYDCIDVVFDGWCAGNKLGTAFGYILDTSDF
jgi:hypothetical protein